MRWLIVAVISGGLAVGVYCAWPAANAWLHDTAATTAGPEGLADDETFRIFAGGIVEGAQREIPLRFEIGGRLKELHVRPGDRIEQGDVLAALDAGVWEEKFAEAGTMLKLARAERDRVVNGASDEIQEAARSKLRAAEAQVRELESQWSRAKQMSRQEGTSNKELEELKTRYDRASARLQTLRARVEELETPLSREDLTIADSKVALAEGAVRRERMMLEKTLLRSPLDGVVLRVLGEAGEVVGPHDPRELLAVVNRSRTRVRAYVEELDALSVRPGQQALISTDGRPSVRYEGTVLSCSPQVGPKMERHLKPGEFVDVRVREVLIDVSGGEELLIGLPVDVFIRPDDEPSSSPVAVSARTRRQSRSR